MNKLEKPVLLNKDYIFNIEDLTSTGEGIAKKDNFTVFIDNTVPGDVVSAKVNVLKKNYAKAQLKKLISSSDYRVKQNFCKYSDICGGCSYANIDYARQLFYKEKTVKDAIQNIGHLKNINVLPIIGSQPQNYRNKAQYKVSEDGIGLYKKNSHDLVVIDECKLQFGDSQKLISVINETIKKFNIPIYDETTHKGLLRGILVRTNKLNEIMIVFIINGKKIPQEKQIVNYLKEKLPNVISIFKNINTKKNNTVLGKETIELLKDHNFYEYIGDRKYKISPSSFFQVNTDQTKVLYDLVKEYADLKKGETVLDLYCGTGTIGIYLADFDINLLGIEINADAIEDAKENAKLNNLNSFNFLCGKAEDIILEDNIKPDCVILDPPRKGCDKKLLDFLNNLKVPRIVYISCNPATLARDLEILNQEYNIIKVQPVDLFPQTGHVESVTLLEIRNVQ